MDEVGFDPSTLRSRVRDFVHIATQADVFFKLN